MLNATQAQERLISKLHKANRGTSGNLITFAMIIAGSDVEMSTAILAVSNACEAGQLELRILKGSDTTQVSWVRGLDTEIIAESNAKIMAENLAKTA